MSTSLDICTIYKYTSTTLVFCQNDNYNRTNTGNNLLPTLFNFPSAYCLWIKYFITWPLYCYCISWSIFHYDGKTNFSSVSFYSTRNEQTECNNQAQVVSVLNTHVVRWNKLKHSLTNFKTFCLWQYRHLRWRCEVMFSYPKFAFSSSARLV